MVRLYPNHQSYNESRSFKVIKPVYQKNIKVALFIKIYKMPDPECPDSSALLRKNPWTCSTVQNEDLPILIGFGNSPFWTISQNLDFDTGITFKIWGMRIKATGETDKSDAEFCIALP